MYVVTSWNWGLYKHRFDNLDDAVYYWCRESEVARLNQHPEPYIEDENGDKIQL